jgi:hypothetical protein
MSRDNEFVVSGIKTKIAFGMSGIAQENAFLGFEFKFVFVIRC